MTKGEPKQASGKMDVEKAESEKSEDEKHLPEFTVEFLKQLPANIRKRVYGLQGIQKEYAKVHEQYLDEMRELEKRYEELYAPYYEKRKDVIQGKVEPTEEEVSKGSKVMEVKEEGEEPEKTDESAPKGIPDFWLTAMKNHEMVDETIFQRDEPCLKYLSDVRCKNFDDPQKGFTLIFQFDENPFFTNAELTKSYHLAEDDEILIEKCEGCTIDWKSGQDLTVTIKKKKQRHKGGKNTRVVTKSEPCDSFFNFFTPPKMPDEDEADEDDDEDALDELEERIEHDYEVGRTIKDRIIPKAIDWFTGEAITTVEFQMGQDGAADDDDDEDDDGHGHGRISGAPKAQPPECKQQ